MANSKSELKANAKILVISITYQLAVFCFVLFFFCMLNLQMISSKEISPQLSAV